MYKYGNLIYSNQKGWIFLTSENGSKRIKGSILVEILDKIGEDGWELVAYNSEAGYLFKKKK